MSVLLGLNGFDLAIEVGADRLVYGSGVFFAANVERRVDSSF